MTKEGVFIDTSAPVEPLTALGISKMPLRPAKTGMVAFATQHGIRAHTVSPSEARCQTEAKPLQA
jgi:hypothetical protein